MNKQFTMSMFATKEQLYKAKAEHLEAQIQKLINSFEELLNAVISDSEYEHDGDPWTEDARAMGEMELDDLKREGKFSEYKELLKK